LWAVYSEADTLEASFYYRDPCDSLGVDQETEFLAKLNQLSGNYLLLNEMQRSVFHSELLSGVNVQYQIPTNKRLFVWRIEESILSVLSEHENEFPPHNVFTVWPMYTLCLD
jgi:hypothetical protein